MNQTNIAIPERNLFFRLLSVIFVTIAFTDFYQSLVVYPAVIIPGLAGVKPVLLFLNGIISIAAIAGALLFFIRWQLDILKGRDDNSRRLAWCTGIIRYWIAVEIFNYGFAKILGTQFAPAYYRADSTWSSLSGLELTWNYFGYSPAFANIIAYIQLSGAALLLFRKTTITGTIILLPVMLNIVCIDIFFGIPTGALTNACLFTAGLIFLLALQYKSILFFLQQSRPTLPAISFKGWKNILRIALLVYAWGFIYYVTTTRQPASLCGKWKVEQLIRNGDTSKANDWLQNDKAWKNIYLEEYGRTFFTPNPYIVERERSLSGLYQVDENQRSITFSLHSDRESEVTTYKVTYEPSGDRSMHWRMTNQQETIELFLTKILPL